MQSQCAGKDAGTSAKDCMEKMAKQKHIEIKEMSKRWIGRPVRSKREVYNKREARETKKGRKKKPECTVGAEVGKNTAKNRGAKGDGGKKPRKNENFCCNPRGKGR